MERITRENWPEDWGQVQPWTPVDEEVYNHFLNTLPPVTFYGDRFQAGEAYDAEYDSYGRYRPRYLTFANCGSDGYFCLGLRFRNDYPLKARLGTWKQSEKQGRKQNEQQQAEKDSERA